jgi:hypothetical protein
MTSVERMQEYIHLNEEPLPIVQNYRPPSDVIFNLLNLFILNVTLLLSVAYERRNYNERPRNPLCF